MKKSVSTRHLISFVVGLIQDEEFVLLYLFSTLRLQNQQAVGISFGLEKPRLRGLVRKSRRLD
jgi:hypothetical protein